MVNNRDKFGLMIDTHRWEEQKEMCEVCKQPHFVRCADCGVRRVALENPGSYHYWNYTYPFGNGPSEIVMPCIGGQLLSKGIVRDTITLCDRCQHPTDNDGTCQHGCTTEHHKNQQPAGTRTHPIIRRKV